jgi:hypothetical protein
MLMCFYLDSTVRLVMFRSGYCIRIVFANIVAFTYLDSTVRFVMSIPEPEYREPPHVLTSVCPLSDFSVQGPSRPRVNAVGLAVVPV